MQQERHGRQIASHVPQCIGIQPFSKLSRAFDRILLPWNFYDDIANGSGVITLTDM